MATPFLSHACRPSISPPNGYAFICRSCKRHESSSRRTRKALKVKPDPSFAPSKTETKDHIIFNPPSSAPNVYHTPLKFLPKTDPRRRLHTLTSKPSAATPSTTTASPINPSSPVRTLPPVRPVHAKKLHVTQEQVDEIRRLRAEDPRTWTRVRLAEKFECSQFFVSLCCCAPEIKAEQDRQLTEIKNRWGRRKTEAREDRQTRKVLWGRDG